MAKGFRLGLVTHDLVFEEGEFSLVEGVDEIARNLKTRLLLNRGEYTLDTSYGFPYGDLLGDKAYNLAELETVTKQFILDTKGVTEIVQFVLDYNGGDIRTIKIDFTVETTFGRLVVNNATSTGEI